MCYRQKIRIDCGYISASLFAPNTSANLGSHQAAVFCIILWVFPPTAILTEPPSLLGTVAGWEYYCHSDCHRHDGDKPALAAGVLAWPGRMGSMAHLLLRLMLSHIRTDVLDECVFSCQGALREYSSPLLQLSKTQTPTLTLSGRA